MQPTSGPSFFCVSVAVIVFIGYIPQINGAQSYGVEPRLSIYDAVPHIIGGENTQIEKVPYQVSVEFLAMHACGGAIVSDTWVLTAGHCVDWRASGPTFLKRIRSGSTWEIPIIGFSGTTHSIAEVKFHPKYSLAKIDYDVGVLKVSNKFQFNPQVQAISIPTEKEEVFLDYNQNATVSGWGLTQIVGVQVPSFILKRGNIPLMTRQQCQELLKIYKFVVTSRMICAAGTGNGGPCSGDSGGPLVHKGKLIGLTSFKVNRCNDPKMPSGFTNLFDEEIRNYVKNQTGV